MTGVLFEISIRTMRTLQQLCAGLIVAVPGPFALSVSVQAAECGCKSVAADSFSDSGHCIVDESGTGYCTLDWRHAEPDQNEAEEAGRAEAGTRALADFAVTDEGLEGLLGEESSWSQLQAIQGDSLYLGAASYLENTAPEDYEQSLALTSIAALIGSFGEPRDELSRSVLVQFISSFPDDVFRRITGKLAAEPDVKETPLGLVADHSAYGCFEIRGLSSDTSDPLGPFDFRIGVRTAYAEDEHCLRR